MSKKHLYFSQMKLLDTFLYLISTTIYFTRVILRLKAFINCRPYAMPTEIRLIDAR